MFILAYCSLFVRELVDEKALGVFLLRVENSTRSVFTIFFPFSKLPRPHQIKIVRFNLGKNGVHGKVGGACCNPVFSYRNAVWQLGWTRERVN